MARSKNVLTTGEVARICNVAARTVSKWVDSGKLRGYRIPGSRDRRIPVNELSRFMKEHHMPMEALGTTTTRILIAASESSVSDDFIAMLAEQGGYDVQRESNAFAIGVTLARFSPHVVVLDNQNPEIHASRLCRTIQTDEEFRGVRIVAMAQGETPTKQRELLQIGFDDCVTILDSYVWIECVEQVMAIIY